jgi:hypothetical protein
MSKQTTDYMADAQGDAVDMAVYFATDIAEMLVRDGEASRDLLNDYSGGDSYHHENHVDRNYRLADAADLLDQLRDWEETDGGLWESQAPRDAIETQAAYTYGNAVHSLWRDLIGELNEEFATLCDDDKVMGAVREAGEDENGIVEAWVRKWLKDQK